MIRPHELACGFMKTICCSGFVRVCFDRLLPLHVCSKLARNSNSLARGSIPANGAAGAQDRQGARPRNPTDAARPRRRGDRVSLFNLLHPLRSGIGRLCCKSRKLQSYGFFAKTQSGKQSPIRITSFALPKSPMSLTRGDEVPHVLTRKSRLQPAEFLITSAKRLLQQNRHISDLPRCPPFCRCWGTSGHQTQRA
jgi:hypothetical protein